MMAYPDFFRKHMQLCIGMAPVMNINHHTFDLAKTLLESRAVMGSIKKLSPQIFYFKFNNPVFKQL
jgi:hypothetical protein